MEKILSIGVAAYNVQDYLKGCVDSIVGSNASDRIELIIVDDGSVDNTKKMAEKFCDKYPEVVRLVSKANGGWGSTLNSSIEVATGKYFKQLDADDMYVTENLEEFIKLLEESNSDVIFTKYQTFSDETGEIMDVINTLPESVQKEGDLSKLPQNIEIPMHGVTIKTSLLQAKPMNITEHCFYTDVEFVIKGINRCKTYTSSDMIIYSYRLDRAGQSVSIEGKRKHYKDHEKALRENLRVYKEELNPKIKDLIAYRLGEMIKYEYEILFILEPDEEHKKELMDFDNFLKKEFIEFYYNVGKKIKLLRASRFVLYKRVVEANIKKKSQ